MIQNVIEPMLPSAVENEAKSHHLEVAPEMQMHVAMIPTLPGNPFLGKMMNIHANPLATLRSGRIGRGLLGQISCNFVKHPAVYKRVCRISLVYTLFLFPS